MLNIVYMFIAGFFINLCFVYGGKSAFDKEWFIKLAFYLIALTFINLSFYNKTDDVLHMSLNDVHDMVHYCEVTQVEHCVIELDMKAK